MDGKGSCILKRVVYMSLYQPVLGTSFSPIVYQVKFEQLALCSRPSQSVMCQTTCHFVILLFWFFFPFLPILVRSLPECSYPQESSAPFSSFRFCCQTQWVSTMALQLVHPGSFKMISLPASLPRTIKLISLGMGPG